MEKAKKRKNKKNPIRVKKRRKEIEERFGERREGQREMFEVQVEKEEEEVILYVYMSVKQNA